MNRDFYQCACTSSEERGTFLENVKEIRKIYILDSSNLKQYHAKSLAVSSRRLPEAEKKTLKINREKNEWNKL
jgi:hypothetical protein